MKCEACWGNIQRVAGLGQLSGRHGGERVEGELAIIPVASFVKHDITPLFKNCCTLREVVRLWFVAVRGGFERGGIRYAHREFDDRTVMAW